MDPDDGKCGYDSSDARGFVGEGGFGWTHWDVCRTQPPPREGGVVVVDDSTKVITLHGCTCELPFEVYPLSLGGRIKQVSTTCTRAGGVGLDWCATKGECGRFGLPAGLSETQGRSWTHWDLCIGEPAGFLAEGPKRIKTREGCVCRQSWTYKPHYFQASATYGGCTDIDRPGTAWCAVDGDDCGVASADGAAFGWTHWVRVGRTG